MNRNTFFAAIALILPLIALAQPSLEWYSPETSRGEFGQCWFQIAPNEYRWLEYDGSDTYYIMDGPYSSTVEVTITGYPYITSLRADVTGDGYFDVLVEVFSGVVIILDVMSGTEYLSCDDEEYEYRFQSVGDIDGDDINEIIIRRKRLIDHIMCYLVYETDGGVMATPESSILNPEFIELGQNYPNPFNPATNIPYVLKKTSDVTIKIYNSLGQEVRRFRLGHMGPGRHVVRWDGNNNIGQRVSSGLYYCELKAENNVLSRKMIAIK